MASIAWLDWPATILLKHTWAKTNLQIYTACHPYRPSGTLLNFIGRFICLNSKEWGIQIQTLPGDCTDKWDSLIESLPPPGVRLCSGPWPLNSVWSYKHISPIWRTIEHHKHRWKEVSRVLKWKKKIQSNIVPVCTAAAKFIKRSRLLVLDKHIHALQTLTHTRTSQL